MKEVFLASAVRTPMGKFGRTLKDWTAAGLAVAAVSESINQASISPDQIDEVIIGIARQAGGGPNVARQIANRAGVPETVPAYTVNKACGSGLKTILLAAQEIMLGRADAILAGGTESMSNTPYYAEGLRWGKRIGNSTLVDGMYRDGFLDPLSGLLMGETAELLAREYSISREEQDMFALRSQQRAASALEQGRFKSEIIPLPVKRPDGSEFIMDSDEHIRPDATMETLEKLKPVFDSGGTITAGNSSGISDGAASVLVVSESFANQHGINLFARIVDYETIGLEAVRMGLGPVPALKKLIHRTKIQLSDIDLIELNEGFAAQVLACDRELGFDHERLNVNGGAIALGHPIGCTGTRIVVTLLHEMRRRNVRRGLATLGITGGMGMALLLESA